MLPFEIVAAAAAHNLGVKVQFFSGNIPWGNFELMAQ